MFDIRRYEMLVRLNTFGTVHADLFPATSGGGKLFAALGATVNNLESHAIAQAAGKNTARQGTSTKNAAGDRVRELLATLTGTAKIVTASTPGFEEKFRLPRSRSDQRLVAAARAVVQEATPFADAIVAHNLPSTFLSDVTAAIDAFESAIQAHATAKESRASARAAISEGLVIGFTIAEQLDTVVANRCGSDAATMAEWNAARHVSLVSIPYPNRKQSAQPAAVPAPKAA